jgi:hypothetical protein
VRENSSLHHLLGAIIKWIVNRQSAFFESDWTKNEIGGLTEYCPGLTAACFQGSLERGFRYFFDQPMVRGVFCAEVG